MLNPHIFLHWKQFLPIEIMSITLFVAGWSHHWRYGYGSIPIDTFLVGWTSIYQLFWGSLGTRVLTHPHINTFQAQEGSSCEGTAPPWRLARGEKPTWWNSRGANAGDDHGLFEQRLKRWDYNVYTHIYIYYIYVYILCCIIYIYMM